MTRPIVCLLAPLLAAPALAAQQPAPVRLDDLVVTATRTPWAAAAVPAAVTVLDGEDLRARGVRFVADALREVPGFALVQGGSYGAVASAFLRGGESDYLKVLVDGVPLNAPGGSLNLADLPLDDVARIEVVRGPASVLHGADAVTGVVQLFTRQGGGKLSGDVAARGGSFGAGEVAGRAAAARGDWSLAVAGSRFASDGIYEFNNRYRAGGGSLRLGWDGGVRGAVSLTARLGDVRAAYPTDGSGVPVDRNQFTAERTLLLGLEGRRQVAGGVNATVRAFGRRLRADAEDQRDGAADTTGFGFEGERTALTWRRGMEATLDWDVATRTRLTAGAGIERESEDQASRTVSNFGSGVFEERGTFEATRTTRHALLQLLAEPTSGLALQAGVRFDDNSAFGRFTTARAGVTLRPTGRTRAWLTAGTAFKAPTFSELFAGSPFEVGNPGLRPERSRSVELGVEHHLANGALTLGTTAFAQEFRDLIQYVSAAPGEPTYANLQGADARGIETTIELRPTSWATLRGHWTWLRTEVTDTGAVSSVAFRQGEALLRRPGASGALLATVRARGAVVGVMVSRVGERDDADFRDFPAARVALPSYVLVDASLDLPVGRPAPGAPALDLTFRAENLLDERYEQVVGFRTRGRTLLGGGRLRF